MNKKVEDLVLDRSFRRWVLKPDKESNLYWEQYIKDHPRQASLIEEARKITLQFPRINYLLSESEISSMWGSISCNLQEVPLKREKVVPLNHDAIIGRFSSARKRSPFPMRYAAAIVLFILAATAWIVIDRSPEITAELEADWIVKEIPLGQKSGLFLNDGSEVILNSGSTIKFVKGFSENERIVYLKGEAFFNVSKDSLRPFKVVTGNIVTQALGTSFNVSAYEPDQNVDVSLVTGRVIVSSGDKAIQEVALLPGEKAVYNLNEKDFLKTSFDLLLTIGWKDRLLAFRDESQQQVFLKLKRWYGVEFKFENTSDKEWNYNAEFMNLDLKNVLGSIAFAMDFDYEIKDDLVTIKFND